MSNALAISGVTATLQYYLGNVYSGLSSTFGGAVTVSSKAPDLVQSSLGDGSTLQNQVNIFLHQVTYNAGWRNAGLPSLAADGQTVLKSPPLALDLHYLLTAYGSSDWQAEALLGYAVMLLHQNPVLARSDITTALNALPTNNASNPLSSELGSSGLAEQFETIKITPSTLGREELAWLWTALKADYRPSFPFQVSVVLMQPSTPLAFSLPVLSRAITVQAGASAQLLQVSPPDHEAAAAPGMLVTVSGSGLAGATGVVLANPRLRIDYPSFTPASTSDTQVTFVVPNAPAALPAGVYNVTLHFAGSRAGLTQSSNTLLLPIAPTILATPAPKATAITGGTQVTLDCAPSVLPKQTVQLIMGGTAVPAQPIASTASQLSFQFTPPLAAGNYLARLQVDGVMSPVAVNWTAQPPSFTGPMVTV